MELTKPRLMLVGRVVLLVSAMALAKWGAHLLEWDVLAINPLFSGIITAAVFLMGFLLSGVLTDFKESEKIPSDMAASLETISVFADRENGEQFNNSFFCQR